MPVDSSVVKDLIDSTVEVFSKMVNMQLPANPEQKGEEGLRRCQLMGMVGLAGRKMGIVSVHCSPQMGKIITANMLGLSVTDVGQGDDVKDAIGEVTNMVAGNFKTKMSRNGELFDLSVPTVIQGENYTTKTMTNAPSVVLEFAWQDEALFVKVALER